MTMYVYYVRIIKWGVFGLLRYSDTKESTVTDTVKGMMWYGTWC